MAEIAKRDGKYYYDGTECENANDAYLMFRREYNASQGRNSYKFLQRLGRREERVHGSKFFYEDGWKFGEYPPDRVNGYQLGLAYGSYSKIVGIWDIPYEIDENWVDWIFRYGGKELRVIGLKQKTGRTNKRKRRYR